MTGALLFALLLLPWLGGLAALVWLVLSCQRCGRVRCACWRCP